MQMTSTQLNSIDAAKNEVATATKLLEYIPVALAILAPLACFLLLVDYFKLLFWFGDEIHLLSEIRHEGYWNWVTSNFAENFVPLFKLLWGGAAIQFGGSYLVMLAILWGTHVMNGLLLATLLMRLGVTPLAIALAVVTFSITASTHESLGWTVQWSAVLATTFFLAALNVLASAMRAGAVSILTGVTCTTLLLASSLCFSRGILVCATVAASAFMWGAHLFFLGKKREAWSFLALSLFAMGPAILSASMIFLGSTGNHQSLLSLQPEKFKDMSLFALHAFAMNPLSRLFGDDTVSWAELFLCLTIKGGIIIWAFSSARRLGALTIIIALTMFCFDIGNSLLLGIGRYHTELRFAIGSRYQYEFLISLAPFIAIASTSAQSLLYAKLGSRRASVVFVLVFIAWGATLSSQWKGTVQHWSGWHGTEGRRALLEMNAAPPGMTGTQLWLGIPPVISYEEAKAVTVEFHLH
jgi:hypothetical protein